jgi:serine phosphatase RsbU (regulator of sigma subunit)
MKKVLLLCFLLATASLSSQRQRKIDSLTALLEKPMHDSDRFNNLVHLVQLQKRTSLNKALEVTEKLCALGEKMTSRRKADAYFYRGLIFWKQGEWQDGLKWSEQSAVIYKQLGRSLDLAQTYHQIGSCYLLQPDLVKALYYYQLSMKLKEEAGDMQGYSNTLGNVGIIYEDMGNHKKAIEYFSRSARIKKEIHDMLGYASCLVNMPAVYNRMGNYGESVTALTIALRIADSLDHEALRGAALGNLSEAYLYQKDYARAEKYVFDCLKSRERTGDSSELAFTYVSISNILGEQGKYEAAIEYAIKAKNISEAHNWTDRLYESYRVLAEGYYHTGKYKLSTEYLFLLKQLGDTIYNEKNIGSINEMEAKYETAKKDAELKLNSEKLKNQQMEITRHNAQKILFAAGLLVALGIIMLVYRGYRQKKKANSIISEQKNQVEEQRKLLEIKNHEVTDSIFYARRIQRALLTSEGFIKKHVPECFVLFKPKDIVSGDFYWASQKSGRFMLMTADCTGHGVPGAFMSLLGMNLLNEIVNERNVAAPHEVLNRLRKGIISALNPEDSTELTQDGMDAVFCSINLKEFILEAACANNPVWLVRNNQLREIFKPDKIPVGKSPKEEVPFTLQRFELMKDDRVYFFTDGYADQFGGPKGKKFKYKQMQEALLEISGAGMEEQKQMMEKIFEDWRGSIEQVDDVLLIGIRV